MADIGRLFLMAGLALSLYSVVALVLGMRRRRTELVASGRLAAWGAVALAIGAFLVLEYLLVSQDFSVAFVQRQTAVGQPLFYTITAVWGGSEGSLLFWLMMLSIYIGAAMWVHRDDHPDFVAYFTAVLMGIAAFSFIILNFEAKPFVSSMQQFGSIPAEGRGLNPLLQNFFMIMHPPFLYAGFTGFSVPFAFAIAALITRRTGAGWIRLSRRWTLVAWGALSIGIMLGGHWAYRELGWGGYWAWDPVENSSLIPWLVSTAFLHSVMVQESRGMLKVWNLMLIIITFTLSIFATFLTRSGIIESIHAFAEGRLGYYFLTFIAIILLGSLLLLFRRLPLLRADNELDGLLSRESAFLLNNVLFVGMGFAVFWGTIYPIISEAATGQRVVVGPPYFNAIVGPMLLATIFLMGIAPMLPWRRANPERLFRNLALPTVAALLTALALALFGVRSGVVLLSLALVAFVAVGHLHEIWRAVKAQQLRSGFGRVRSLTTLVSRNRRRYGGYLIHLGVTVMALGIVVSSVYREEMDVTVTEGETISFGNYRLTYTGAQFQSFPTKERLIAPLDISNPAGDRLTTLYPARDFYPALNQPETEVAIRFSLTEDLYTVFIGPNEDGTVTFKLFLEPLIGFVWLGGIILVLGSFIVVWPDPREGRILERARASEMQRQGAVVR